MNDLQIKYINTEDIKPYENNPRHNEDAVPYVAKSIQEFGFKNPIILSSDNVIIAGHTRLKAAESLGITEVPCIYADDLTEDQIKAFRLADNKVAEMSAWDFGKLEEELADIDIDMSEFGFSLNFEEGDSPQQKIKESEEVDLSEYDDENFECECPRCGFKFNRS